MRFSIAVLCPASLVSAFTVLKRQDSAPACATTCLKSSDPTPCNTTDTPCLCLNANYITALANCVKSSCTDQNDLQAAEAAALAYCKASGVDLKDPLPSCATPCSILVPNTNSCALTDDACWCKDTSYVQIVSTCVHNSCTGQDITTAELVGEALCRANGVDVSSTVGAA